MKLVKNLLIASAVSGLLATSSFANHHGETKIDMVKMGEKIFNTKKIGNCLACHDVNGKKIDNPGSLGPKLTGLAYYPESYIFDAIYDIYKAKNITTSAMPAFGKNGQLSDEQINALVAYLKTVN